MLYKTKQILCTCSQILKKETKKGKKQLFNNIRVLKETITLVSVLIKETKINYYIGLVLFQFVHVLHTKAFIIVPQKIHGHNITAVQFCNQSS